MRLAFTHSSRRLLRPRFQCNKRYSSVPPRLTSDRSAVGVFTPQAAAVFALTGVGLFFYFRSEKEKLHEKRRQELADKKIGRAHVGGAFTLATHDGKTFSDKDLIGRWSLIYFGFTNCPDICPDELDKMGIVVNKLDAMHPEIRAQPVFISVDPARDSQNALARYMADFHPRIVGLCGSYDEIKAMCKIYRVYFSTPPGAKPEDDYLVDHSIFFYVMDPNGEFVDAFGRASTADEVVEKIDEEIKRWERLEGGKLVVTKKFDEPVSS